MSAMEQTTVDPVTSTPAQPVLPLPSVEYNLAGKTIMATVVISASKTNSDEYDYQIPPICVPGPTDSTWSVEWRLVAVTSGLSAIFTDPAVIVPNPMPPDILLRWSLDSISELHGMSGSAHQQGRGDRLLQVRPRSLRDARWQDSEPFHARQHRRPDDRSRQGSDGRLSRFRVRQEPEGGLAAQRVEEGEGEPVGRRRSVLRPAGRGRERSRGRRRRRRRPRLHRRAERCRGSGGGPAGWLREPGRSSPRWASAWALTEERCQSPGVDARDAASATRA